jgi:hypothetical protein
MDDRVKLRFSREPACNRDRPLVPIAKAHKGPFEPCKLERVVFSAKSATHLRTPYIALLVDTEIRNIERLVIRNLNECHTVIPTIYPRILGG